ncbi:phenylalanine--tRNA ligase subunit alpha [Candidatus Woesearchaeota archaeon]|nr:phenylalanine--tRNA ligase subunit alpha [Candidatus Woesearchaeota archaeon]
MDINKLINKLHPLERKVLPVLDKSEELKDISKKAGLKEVEAMRALQWLSNKEILKIKEDIKEVAELGKNGKEYLEKGMPEKRFLDVIKDKAKDEDKIKEKLNKQEYGACIGILKKNSTIAISKEKGKLKFKATPAVKFFLENLKKTEEFLKKDFPVELNKLSTEERKILEELKKRKDIIEVDIKKSKRIELTDIGKRILKKGIKGKVEDKLTSEMLKKGSWKNKKFRGYDVSINVPVKFGGKKQHYRRFLDEVRNKFISLGFIEMDGPIVESDFWDMDVLYMPQFHSARDIHEAYYVKDPEFSDISKKILDNVKKAHENGFDTGSKGWGYKFDPLRTKRNLLRTQGTACSARMLASDELKIPAKYFAITRCFRYDVIDATHLPDFNQVEGIVVEEGLNIKHLFGLLQMFARKFADTEEIKLVPGYFPFTEPSVELFAKHPELGWIELGGAGIFRPEVTKPLGINVPVIAWGLGIDRIAMFKLGLKDIRDLFSHNLDVLRKTKVNI